MHITNTKPCYGIKYVLITLAVLMLLGSMSINAAVDEHTVAVWLFEEGAGKTVKDVSGNGHDGKFAGSPKWVKAKFGTGLELPGDAGGYVVVDSTKNWNWKHLVLKRGSK